MAKDKENVTNDVAEQSEKKEFKEITLKFGKGLVGETFQGKDGKDYKQISIPNQDQNDKDDCYRCHRRLNKVRLEFIIGFWPDAKVKVDTER